MNDIAFVLIILAFGIGYGIYRVELILLRIEKLLIQQQLAS